MKSDRLVALLLALQNHGKRSASKLAQMLEVSPRTIYRDIDALSAAGVPIYAERGAHGGVILADSFRDALGRLDEDELSALFVSSDDVLADVGLIGRRGSALQKIANALPDNERAKLQRRRGRVHIDTRRWAQTAAPNVSLLKLRDAVWADRRVTFAYADRAGTRSNRSVDPLGLVVKAGVWYLVAQDRDAVKTFRLQRISDVHVSQHPFTRPADFDLAAYWDNVAATSIAHTAPFRVTINMADRALANAQVYLDVKSHLEIPNSSPRMWSVNLEFSSAEAAMFEITGWNADVVVVAPQELRERLAARGRDLLESYGPAEQT